MKKKLSDDTWQKTFQILAILGFLGVCALIIRSISLSWDFGLIDTFVPIIQAAPQAPEKMPQGGAVITEHTAAIGLTPKFYYFGSLKSFSQTKRSSFDAVIIPRNDHDLENLEALAKAIQEQKKLAHLPIPDPIGVIISDSQVPLPAVLQTIQYLKVHGLFKNLVLAGGILPKKQGQY